MQYGSTKLRAGIAAMLALAVAGCGVPPVMTAAPLPDTPPQPGLANAGDEGAAFPRDEWWAAYADPGLDALIAEALANSPDMALAAARLRAADALVDQWRATSAPTIAVEGSVGGTKQSENMGIPPAFVPKGLLSTGRLAGVLQLDLDLWGRNRALLAAARGEAAAAKVDAAQARITLASAVALAWGDIARLEASQNLAQSMLDIHRNVERLTAGRMRAGLDNEADLALATARRAASEQALGALDEGLTLSRHRLAALLGSGPGRADTLPHPHIDLAASSRVPQALAASLVARRPDLASARLRAEAATARVRAARAAFFPDINLSAVAGLQSLGLDALMKEGSTFANFGPALSLPLFTGGRISGQYAGAAAGYDEAVARYNATLIGAFHEVADALASKRAVVRQLADARAAAAAADEAARLARLRHREGLANLLQVYAAEDTALSARRSVIELETRGYLTDVTLVKALGGGFIAPAPTTEKTR